MGSTKDIRCKRTEWSEQAIDAIEIPPDVDVHALVIAPNNRPKSRALVSHAIVEDVSGKPHLFVLIAPDGNE